MSKKYCVWMKGVTVEAESHDEAAQLVVKGLESGKLPWKLFTMDLEDPERVHLRNLGHSTGTDRRIVEG